jgi:hypothetical protein
LGAERTRKGGAQQLALVEEGMSLRAQARGLGSTGGAKNRLSIRSVRGYALYLTDRAATVATEPASGHATDRGRYVAILISDECRICFKTNRNRRLGYEPQRGFGTTLSRFRLL